MARLNVLVVEDNVVLAELVTDMVESMGHSVVLDHSAEAALKRLSTSHMDVLLTDMSLGNGLSGIELLTVAGDRAPQTVIFMSGSPAPEHLPEAALYLGKPFTWQQLERVFARATG